MSLNKSNPLVSIICDVHDDGDLHLYKFKEANIKLMYLS